MRKFLKSLMNRKAWPSTKRGYQSEVDLFLQSFNAARTEESASRRVEREKGLEIARKRDTVVPVSKKLWDGF